MNKLLLLCSTCLLLFCCTQLNAQNDTVTTLYDFENLVNGNLNGQSGWITTKYNTTVDWRVADTISSHTSKVLFFNQSGPSVGADASRILDSASNGFTFDKTPAVYILEFDIKRNYWGLDIGLAADLNGDGVTLKSNTNEKAFIFQAGSLNGERIYLPNNGTYSLGNTLGSNWQRIQIVMNPFNGVSGTYSVGKKAIGGQFFTNMVFNSPMYVDTFTTTKTNISRWNVLYLHAEGAGSFFDNISLTKITPTVTSLNEQNSAGVSAYYYDHALFVNQKGNTSLHQISIIDAAGREMLQTSLEGAGSISLQDLKGGWYCALVGSGRDLIRVPFYAE